ncbi:MAG TPA: hypothetical protein PKJ04_03890 [Nitrospira sp.]|nr:hypothetical protein [Nitrospira sp.]MBS0161384.1 hypothetical protein [Nitrospira sp.]MBS0176227.1 hypothetical protein [Nitrospira sp.]MBX3336045.1 hypothetical protein [Nitrospira sp.]MCW5778783.1 hypothetical protein [Nitrospira sp.]
MRCPTTDCGQTMEPDSRAGYDAVSGLEYLCCPRCRHRGMKARDGVQLLFTGQHEYLFSYGPSLSHLKVVLSTVAINLFRVQGIAPTQLAGHVADWALLTGQVCGTVRFSGDLVLSSCYEYCRQQTLHHSGVSPV